MYTHIYVHIYINMYILIKLYIKNLSHACKQTHTCIQAVGEGLCAYAGDKFCLDVRRYEKREGEGRRQYACMPVRTAAPLQP